MHSMQQAHHGKLLRRGHALLQYRGCFRLLLCISACMRRQGLLHHAKQGSQVTVQLLLLLQLLLSPRCLPAACGSRLQDVPAYSRCVPAIRDTLHLQPFHQVQKQAEAPLRAATQVWHAKEHSLCKVCCLQHLGPVQSILIRGPFEHVVPAPSLHIGGTRGTIFIPCKGQAIQWLLMQSVSAQM